ncbi:hypothetical protein CIK05_14860 [Bdellovibrio sp. qaytius]|nr:hypothetical protein CIK05_14860 [Bdellovibrio sp. qaytius]
MKKFSKAVFTMMIIFGAAYMLMASGCKGSNSDSGTQLTAPAAPNGDVQDDASQLEPLKPDQVRECTDNEFVQLVSWRNAVDKANGLVDAAKGKQQPQAVDASLTAIRTCDSRFSYHKEQPCKKTKKTIVSTQVKVYDAYTINRDCQKVEGYLTKFNLRPDKTSSNPAPVPVEPGAPQPTPNPFEPTPTNPQPLPVEPGAPQPAPDVPNQGTLSACSQDEFSRLSEWSASLDRANKSIAKLGSQSDWKYDDAAISNSALAAKSCETIIKYHASRPCEKNIKQDDGSVIKRQYTEETVRNRCQTTRTYFYEYVQNQSTLIFPNADLYVDLSHFQQQRFEAQSFVTLGSCVAENRTDAAIDYSSRKALVTETRGFEQKMIVLITAEGLKIDCYGLDVDGAFSKRQVVKLLQTEGTDLRLEYRLK